jgi:hypothetical protein
MSRPAAIFKIVSNHKLRFSFNLSELRPSGCHSGERLLLTEPQFCPTITHPFAKRTYRLVYGPFAAEITDSAEFRILQ